MTTNYGVGNLGPGLGQAQTFGGIKRSLGFLPSPLIIVNFLPKHFFTYLIVHKFRLFMSISLLALLRTKYG